MIGGWYDVFIGPQIRDWNRLSTKSGSRFVLGPWTHAGSTGDAFELDNASGGLFQWREMLDWFGHHLKGDELKSSLGVNVYVMGKMNGAITMSGHRRPKKSHIRSAKRLIQVILFAS